MIESTHQKLKYVAVKNSVVLKVSNWPKKLTETLIVKY